MSKRDGPLRAPGNLEQRYPTADKAATEVAINLLRADSLLAGALNRRFRAYGLSIATFNVLMILEGASDALCPAEIGKRLLVTRGTVTGLLDSLEKQGLISRTPDKQDRRMLRIQITPKALDLLDRLLPEHFKGEAELLAGLTPREKETLIKLLGKAQASVSSSAG
ncbi:MAG TPA: MarR family transcriptional regulator [Actinomycetota bacterium]|nr:MarR family transcriptional regulator [Actinomycetota bacterium]